MLRFFTSRVLQTAIALFIALGGHSVSMAQSTTKNNAEHTILIYMIGSDLESESQQGTADLAEISSAGNVPKVNVVIQTGGADAAGWRDARRKLYSSGKMKNVANLGEINMATESALREFMDWGVQKYPAKRYSLIFWSHGSGAINLEGRDYGIIGPDENFDDALSIYEITDALSKLKRDREIKFDLVGFDACLMGSLEIAQHMAPYASYFVASQELVPGEGWAYGKILNQMKVNPGMGGRQLSKVIVDTFFQYYEEEYGDDENSITFSVLDLDKLPRVNKAMSEWASSIHSLLTRQPELAWIMVKARSESENYGRYGRWDMGMIDLFGYVDNLGRLIAKDPEVRKRVGATQLAQHTREFLDAVEGLVIYSRRQYGRPQSKGVSVFIPSVFHLNTEGGDVRQYNLSKVIKDSNWLALFKAYMKLLTDTPTGLALANLRPDEQGCALHADLVGNDALATDLFNVYVKNRDGRKFVMFSEYIPDEEYHINNQKISSPYSGEWLYLAGQPLNYFLFDDNDGGAEGSENSQSEDSQVYRIGVRAKVNGKDSDLIVKVVEPEEAPPSYSVLGHIPFTADRPVQRRPTKLKVGDKVQLLYYSYEGQDGSNFSHLPYFPPIEIKKAGLRVDRDLPPREAFEVRLAYTGDDDRYSFSSSGVEISDLRSIASRCSKELKAH